MPAEQQKGHTKRKRRPKTRSTHRRGGDRVSVAAKTAQVRRDADAYKMRVEGFDFATIATYLGVGEEAARASYWRAARSQPLATIEESRGLAFAEIEQRRQLIWVEIRKVQAMLGTDKKKRFDAGELRHYMEMLNQCAIRQARLQGLDSPVKLGVAWTGAPRGGDVLTADQLNNLSNDELRALFHLLDKAQHGQSVEVESHHVPDTKVFMPEQPEIDPRAADFRESMDERDRSMARLKELHDILANGDPVTRVSDPVQRRAVAGEYNRLAARFGAPMWVEPKEPDWGN